VLTYGEAISARLGPLGRRRFLIHVGLAALVTVNVIGLTITAAAFVYADVGVDWAMYELAGYRVFAGDLYNWPDGGIMVWRYSPIMAYAFAFVAPLGYLGWTALHFASLVLIPRRLALLTLAAWPFWNDVYNGNTLTFVFVTAVLALRGSRPASVGFFALTLLMPRPFMLPLAAFLIWKDRHLWWPIAAVFVAHAIAVAWSGWGPAWVVELLGTSRSAAEIFGNFGPTRVFGPAWLLVGAPLAAWLTVRGRVGFAGLALSPYILAPYYLMGLLELVRPDGPFYAGVPRDVRLRQMPIANE
jgi:hypothetical protein